MRNKKNKNSELAQEWFNIGNQELGYAKAAFDDFDNFYSQMCVQCHQAVEKYLKGFLVYHNKRYPITHDLVKILRKCAKIDNDFLNFLSEIKIITDYYIELRYPIHYPPRTKEDAKQAIKIAKTIKEFVLKKIKDYD